MSVLKDMRTPVFYAEGAPDVTPESYRLTIDGLVGEEKEFDYRQIRALKKMVVDARLTSVSGWSVRAEWGGVLFTDFLKEIWPRPGATHVTFTSIGGYDTTVSLEDLAHPRVLLAYEAGGEPLEIEYGGPVRLFVPHLWGYKSCKALARITFTDRMQGGYWEDRGYTSDARIEPGVTLDINTGKKRAIKGGEVTDF